MTITTDDLACPERNAKAIAMCNGSTDALGVFYSWDKATFKMRAFFRTLSDSMLRDTPPLPYKAAKKPAKVAAPAPDDEPDVDAFGDAPGALVE